MTTSKERARIWLEADTADRDSSPEEVDALADLLDAEHDATLIEVMSHMNHLCGAEKESIFDLMRIK